MSILSLFLGFLFPAVLAMVVAALTPQLWRRAGGIIAGGGFCLAYAFLKRTPQPPGQNVMDWVFYLAIALAVLSLCDALLRPRMWLRAIVLIFLIRAAVRLSIGHAADPNDAESWIDGMALAALLWYGTLETLAGRIAGASVPFVLAVLALGVSVWLVAWANIASNAMVVGAMVALAVAVGLAGLWRRNLPVTHGMVAVFAGVLLLLLVNGYFYGTFDGPHGSPTPIDQYSALVLLLSPVAAWAGELPGIRRRRPLARNILGLACVIVLMALADAMPLWWISAPPPAPTAPAQSTPPATRPSSSWNTPWK